MFKTLPWSLKQPFWQASSTLKFTEVVGGGCVCVCGGEGGGGFGAGGVVVGGGGLMGVCVCVWGGCGGGYGCVLGGNPMDTIGYNKYMNIWLFLTL